MAKENQWKKAPTWLYPPDEKDPQLFNTQSAVDQAWEDGWYGPKGLKRDEILLSGREWESKGQLAAALGKDSRYKDFSVNFKNSWEEIIQKLKDFEGSHDVEDEPIEEE